MNRLSGPQTLIAADNDLLARLRQRQVSESELVELAAEVADWLKES